SATRRNASEVAMVDFTIAVERIVAGLEKKSRILGPKEREIVAAHEMGHALVALSLPGTDVVHKVSIIPRGIGALGYTIQRPTEDRYLMTRDELENKMAVLLGGRAAEQVIFGRISTGAADDLAKVTDIARSMVTRFGMVPELGYVTYETQRPTFLDVPMPPGSEQRVMSDETLGAIDHAIQDIVGEAFKRAMAILQSRRPVLEAGMKELLFKETLDQSDLARLFAAKAA
ncbi:MAG TPA: cell division protein FtsH, partial [Candidatus Cybelea sp.]|nr:cell division protein FtsH [Candidatus Cybelea sp.]